VYVLRGSLPAAIEQLEIARRAGDGDFYDLSAVDARMRELKAEERERRREER
jgi:predicted Zn-dependent protease